MNEKVPNSNPNYGALLNEANIKLHRKYFKQMTDLLGINCKYFAPLPGKDFNMHGDLEANYAPPSIVGCVLENYPDQKSLKKRGWVAELHEGSMLLHVPYDLPNLQAGALFELPGGLDNAEGRLFRVLTLQNTMIYPASITCEIALEYQNSDEAAITKDFTKTNFNALVDYAEDD